MWALACERDGNGSDVPIYQRRNSRHRALHDRIDSRYRPKRVDGELAHLVPDGDVDGCIERNVEHIDGASARARLNDWNPLYLGVDQRVGVAAHDHIDFGRQVLGKVDDLAPTSRGAIASAVGTGVSNHHDEIRTSFPERGTDAVDDWRWIVKAETDDISSARGRRGGNGRQTNNSDLCAPTRNDGVVWNPFDVPPIGVADVGPEDSELCLPHPRPQRIHAPVELVISQRCSGVAHSIVVVDDRPAKRKVRGRGSLEHVAGIEQQNLAARLTLALRTIDRSSDVRRSAPPDAVHIGSRFERAVKVIGADYPQKARSGWKCRTRRRYSRRYRWIHRRHHGWRRLRRRARRGQDQRKQDEWTVVHRSQKLVGTGEMQS